MPTLDQLRAGTAKMTVHLQDVWGGGELIVSYRPSAYTPDEEARINRMAGSKGYVELAEKLITEWDLMDGDTAVPLTTEALRTLPSAFLMEVCLACARDMAPNPRTAGRSGGSSSLGG